MATDKKDNAAQDAAKKALDAVKAKKAAEKTKVEHTYTQVGQQSAGKEELLAVTKKNALPYRIAAFILWFLGIGFEVFAILFYTHTLEFSFTTENPGWMISWIVCLVLDLICVIIGSQMWKKGNHLDPASAKNKVRFWFHNNLGVIFAVIAFAPFIIIVLTDKKSDGKTKAIAAIVAAVALIIAGLTSVDWNPVSREEMLEAAGIDTVYWTDSGTVFHAFDDCSHLNHSVNLNVGSSTAAIENGKTRMCKTCENRLAAQGDTLADISSGDKTNENDTPAGEADKETEPAETVDDNIETDAGQQNDAADDAA